MAHSPFRRNRVPATQVTTSAEQFPASTPRISCCATNGVDDLAIAADGVFFFATPLVTGTDYNISIHSQPSGQLCTLANGSGTVGTANALGASVTCLSLPVAPTFYYVGGTISGLNAAGLVLRNNGVDDLAIAADGVFFFATRWLRHSLQHQHPLPAKRPAVHFGEWQRNGRYRQCPRCERNLPVAAAGARTESGFFH